MKVCDCKAEYNLSQKEFYSLITDLTGTGNHGIHIITYHSHQNYSQSLQVNISECYLLLSFL